MEERAQIPVGRPVADPLPSYWQTPKSPLANVIEPGADGSDQIYDYAIVGSGISGTMIAYNLLHAHPRARIVMLEAREICSGATGRNGGHTKAASYRSYMQHVQELGKEEALKIARLEYANIIETHRLAEELGIDCESQLCNTVDVIYEKGTFEMGKMAIQALRADASEEEKQHAQMAWYKIHDDVSSVARNFHVAAENGNPALAGEQKKVVGAFEYLAGRIHAYRFTTSILQECIKKGLQLCANTPVHAIHPSDTPNKDSHQPLWTISTPHSTITTPTVILATNGYTANLLPMFQSAIVPMRGQITAQNPGSATKLPTPLPTTYSFIYQNGYEYMIPQPLGSGSQHLIIGGGLGRLPNLGATEYGTVDDGALNTDISTYLHGSLTGYFGEETWGDTTDDESSHRVVREWTGIMGATADGRPFVDEVPGHRGVWMAAGFNGHGMVLCVKVAEALVEMMDGGGVKGIPEWFPRSFLVEEERLGRCRFEGRTNIRGCGRDGGEG